ncbi:MAG: ABC transporter ATP-binding protein [Victivallales bacterium]|nr:ABC transporter ATP-binding protein [Victivallales bacterium]
MISKPPPSSYPPSLIGYIVANRKAFYTGVLLAFIRAAVITPIPWLFQIIIDDNVKTGNIKGIIHISILIVGLLLLHYVFAVLGFVAIMRENSILMIRLRGDIFHKLHFLNFGYLDRQKTGRLLSKYAFDTQKIEGINLQIMNTIMPNTVYSLSITIILIIMQWRLALILILLLPLYFLSRLFFDSRMRLVNNQNRIAQEKLTGTASEVISSLRLVRSFGEEDQVTNNIDEHSHALAKSRFHLSSAGAVYSTFAYTIVQAFSLLVVAGGAIFVVGGSMTMGTLLAFMAGLPIVLMPVQMFTAIFEQYFIAREGYQSVKELLDSHYVEDWNGQRRPDPVRGEIIFDKVSFTYPETSNTILHNLNLHIKAGSNIALVGPSGSGKSTIAQLILGLYKPKGGNILIDGIPQSELDMRWLRRNSAVVLQDIVLFSGTIADNIRFALPDATDEAIHHAAGLANADEFIQSLPNKYNTIVGERGVMLSGGQRQRISIARAILRNPFILILDEATSSLDYESERLVQDAIARIVTNRTVITIAHRLSTIQQAERIIVMRNGSILEEGKFNELVANEGPFSKILKMQMRETSL